MSDITVGPPPSQGKKLSSSDGPNIGKEMRCIMIESTMLVYGDTCGFPRRDTLQQDGSS